MDPNLKCVKLIPRFTPFNYTTKVSPLKTTIVHYRKCIGGRGRFRVRNTSIQLTLTVEHKYSTKGQSFKSCNLKKKLLVCLKYVLPSSTLYTILKWSTSENYFRCYMKRFNFCEETFQILLLLTVLLNHLHLNYCC